MRTTLTTASPTVEVPASERSSSYAVQVTGNFSGSAIVHAYKRAEGDTTFTPIKDSAGADITSSARDNYALTGLPPTDVLRFSLLDASDTPTGDGSTDIDLVVEPVR